MVRKRRAALIVGSALFMPAVLGGADRPARATVPGAPARAVRREVGAGCGRVWAIDRRLGGAHLAAVALDAAGVWAVGDSGGKGLILRLERGRWSSTTIGPVSRVVDVAAARGEVWAVADIWHAVDATSTGVVLRRSGGRWRTVKVPGLPPAALGFSFSGLALRDGEVWLVGAYDNTHVAAGQPVDDWRCYSRDLLAESRMLGRGA